MANYPCPRCNVPRQSLNASCVECGWSPGLARQDHHVVLPRRVSRDERTALFAAFVGGIFGLLIGWGRGVTGAILVVSLCAAYAVTLVALLIRASSVFTRTEGRPQFSLKSVLAFIAGWAVLLTIIQLIPAQGSKWLFEWHLDLPSGGLYSIVNVAIGLATISWCFTLPVVLLFNAWRPLRYSPSPVFAYCFLSAVVCLLTQIILALAVGEFWPFQYSQLAVVLVILSAIGFLVESKTRTFDHDHTPEAVLAIVLACQTYFALLSFMAGVYRMAAG
jgi:hypothetical protein